MGGHGGISVTANVVPELLSNAYDSAIRGNANKAKEIDLSIAGLHRYLFLESNPIPVKWAMHKLGYCDSGIRLPLTILSEENKLILEKELTGNKLL